MNNEEEIENTIIFTDQSNHTVRVRDVAEVKREYDVSESYIEYNGHPCVILSLEMMEGNNIVQYGKDVQKVMDEYVATRTGQYPPGKQTCALPHRQLHDAQRNTRGRIQWAVGMGLLC